MSSNANVGEREWREVLTKLEGIAALKDNGGTEYEMQVASEKLTRMLARYNLTMQEFEAKRADSTSTLDTFITDGIYIDSVRDGWKISLLTVLSKHNFCKAVSMQGNPVVFVVGQARNIEAVRQFYEQIKDEVIRLTDEAWRQNKGQGTKAKFSSSYRLGLIYGLNDKLGAASRSEIDANPNGRALVIVSERRLNQFLDETFGKLSSRKRQAISNYDAFSQGKRDASRLGNARAVSQGAKALGSGS